MLRALAGGLFALLVAFLFGPIVTVVVLSFGGPDSGLTFPMRGVSLHWFAQLVAAQRVGDLPDALGRTAMLAAMVTAVTVFNSVAAGI